MKRHLAAGMLVVAIAAVFVAGGAGKNEAGLFDHHHHHRRAPACDPCAPGGYPGAVSTFYGPTFFGRSAFFAPRRSFFNGSSFYRGYTPAYYTPAYYGPTGFSSTAGARFSGFDPCCPTASVAPPCDPCGSVCGPSFGSASGCPGGVCPPGVSGATPRAGTPTPDPMSNDLPPYEERPAPSGVPRTFEENGADEPMPPSTDAFRQRERSPEAAPVNEPIEETPAPGTEAFRPTAPDVSSPAIPMPEIDEPVPARPMTPEDAPAEDPNDSDDADDSDVNAVPAGAPAPARPMQVDERNIAWRAVPAATRSVLTVTYSQPDAVRAPSRINDGWTPKPRGPEFVRN